MKNINAGKDMTGRLFRLKSARGSMIKRLAGARPSKMPLADTALKAKVEAWKRRLAEYETSIANLVDYGWEIPPTGNPIGAQIGVPTAGKTPLEN